MTEERRRTLLERLVGWPALDEAQRTAFRDEAVATNVARFRVVLPVMTLLHLAHVPVFWLTEAERATVEPGYALWRDAVVGTHVASAVVAAALSVWVLARDRVGGARLMGPVAASAYLVHGAVIAGVDQLNAPNVSPYMAYSLAVAFLTAMEPPMIAAVYAVGLSAFITAIVTMQPDAAVRLTLLPNGPSVTVASVALALFLYGSRRRDFWQRLTIDRQRHQLETLNAELSAQVEAQVAEIVTRAEEVEQLNARLQEQVRDRSRELARALERLALQTQTEAVMAPGTILGGRFEVGGPIGSGGMGAVYAGTDALTGTAVAIKVIRASQSAPVSTLRRFLREARAAASVNHRCIVKMLEIDISEDGTFYQVQELVPGETLHAVLRRQPRLLPGPTARLMGVLLDGLAAAHAQGVVHRDVKPANLMLTHEPPGLKILDFGISKVHQEDPVLADDLGAPTLLPGDEETRVGVVLGTPAYMGPEQLRGSHNTTDRADVFAAGVVAALALTGEHPSAHDTLGSTAPADLAQALALVPEDLRPVIGACLAADPALRPSAAEAAAQLHAYADAQGTPSLVELVATGAFRGIDDAETSLPVD